MTVPAVARGAPLPRSASGPQRGYLREYTQNDPDSASAAFYGVADTPPAAIIPPQKCARLDATLWPPIAERARHEGLRDLASEYGVSHETIRAIVRRVARRNRDVAAAD